MYRPLIDLKEQMNQWGADGTPFLFLIDFEQERPRLWALEDLPVDEVLYDFHGLTNAPAREEVNAALSMASFPLDPGTYRTAFEQVQLGLKRGDSFLLNLTFPTPVLLNGSLRDVFYQTSARYRMWLKNEFVSFSPEIFVQIRDGRIYSYPMKGTLSTQFPAQQLLDDPKEQAEHATIVDLIRNDLSQIARKVRVKRYRYVESVGRPGAALWQTSSEVSGELPTGFENRLGDLLLTLLPAGSISGAPKPSTVEIIKAAEGQARGYYTGIAAIWDGRQLDSCVLIRFIEEGEKEHRYWSGGGITAYSNWYEEYTELKEKVYLPTTTASYIDRTTLSL